jgi:hypothetical protein
MTETFDPTAAHSEEVGIEDEKEWTQVGGFDGSFFKFVNPGDTLTGVWRGSRKGQFDSPLGTVDTPEGSVTFPMNTTLVTDLASIALGTTIRVTYTGKAIAKKSGREFKAFKVYQAK